MYAPGSVTLTKRKPLIITIRKVLTYMGNIGCMVSVGKIDNGGEVNIQTRNFYGGTGCFASQGLQIDNQLYNPEYQKINKSNDKELEPVTSNVTGVGNCFLNYYGKLWEIKSVSTTSLNLNKIDLLSGVIESQLFTDIVDGTFVVPHPHLFKCGGTAYIGEFKGYNNSTLSLWFRSVDSDSTTFYLSKDPVNVSGASSQSYNVIYDCVTDNIYIKINRNVYKYDFNLNTYTFIKTLPDVSLSYYVINNNILFAIDSNKKFLKIDLLNENNFTLITTFTGYDHKLTYCDGVIIGCYYNSYYSDYTVRGFCYDISSGLITNSTIKTYTTTPTIKIVDSIDNIMGFACSTVTDSVTTKCFSNNVYECESNTITHMVIGNT